MQTTREEAWKATKKDLTPANVAAYLTEWGIEGAQLTVHELARLSNSTSTVVLSAPYGDWLASEIVRYGQHNLNGYREELYPEMWQEPFSFGDKLTLILPHEEDYCGLLSYRFGAPKEHPDRGGLRITLETQACTSITGGVLEMPIWTVGEVRVERDDSVGMVSFEYVPLTAADFAPVNEPGFQKLGEQYLVASNSFAYALVAAHAYYEGQRLAWLIESRLPDC